MSKHTIILAAVAGLVFAFAPVAQAQTVNWTGGAALDEWTDDANWSAAYPNAAGAVANFQVPYPKIDVTIATPVTVGVIDDAKGDQRGAFVRSFSGNGSIIVDNNGSEAIWDWGYKQGMDDTFTLGVPVTLNDDLAYNGISRIVTSGWAMNQPISGMGQLHLQIGDDDNTTGKTLIPDVFMDMNVTNTYSGGTVVSSHYAWDAEHGATVRLNAEQSLGTGDVSLKAGLVEASYNPNATTMTNFPCGSLWVTDDSADSGGDGDNRIDDSATLSLESWNDTVSTFYTWVHLDAGVHEVVSELYFEDVNAGAGPQAQAVGTWGATGSLDKFGNPPTNINDDYFMGTGVIEVIPFVIIVPGDVDGDGDVDLADVGYFEAQFGASGLPLPPGANSADLDEDGDVDLDDLVFIRDNFGYVSAAPPAATPEPATMTVLAIGGLMALGRRRRRSCR